MSAVIRGRSLALNEALGGIAQAMEREFPRHLRQIPSANSLEHMVLGLCAPAHQRTGHRRHRIVQKNTAEPPVTL